ncbi:DUF637 domain-containing protein [Pseudomonas sp. R1-15]|uniref:DUF637 domain-containing protein n=1 Tax=Pseudomonas sp. R1-15 TaxID=2817399 RepID=UPI003DA933C1
MALTAIATGAASNATISFINNGGNLGAVFEDVTSSDALRGYVVSGVTAGLTASIFDKMTGTTTTVEGVLPNAGKVIAQGGLGSLEGIGRFGANQLLQNGTSTLLDRALGGNSQFDDALRSSLANTFAAAGFNLVGDLGKGFDLKEGGLAKVGLHAVMGGLAAEVAGGDFKTGALAAGLNEALVDTLAKQYDAMQPDQKQRLWVMNSQLIGVLAAAAGGGDAADLQTGSWAAQNSTQYNRQLHPDEIEFASDKERVKRYAAQNGLTEEKAQQELLRTAAAMVDRGWDSVLTEGKTARAADYLRVELNQYKSDTLFKVSLADYNNERVGLVELFKDKTALDKMLKNVALVDPLDYRTDARYMREVLDAKGRGSQEGFALAVEGMASGPSKAALWAMGAANCPSCAAADVQEAWNAVLSIPEELRLKGYLDNLHIMQGGGAAVLQSNEASSTAIGVGIGVALEGGLSGLTTGKTPVGIVGQGPKPVLVYLDNNSSPDIRNRLIGAVQDVRQDLPDRGNVAFAEINIPALSSEQLLMKSFSGYDQRVDDFLPKPNGSLDSWVLKPDSATSKYIGGPGAYLRDADTEFKILETVAQRLGQNTSATGRINLLSEKAVCPSCTGVILQFRELYPNIQLNVFTRD